jgi:hypothetical protein
MPRIHNRAKMSVTGTPGTGAATLNAAVSGFQTFATAGIQDGDLVDYTIEDGSNFECGVGQYASSGTSLTRLKITDSSNSGSAISATSAAIVYVTVLDNSIVTRGKSFAASLGQQWP